MEKNEQALLFEGCYATLSTTRHHRTELPSIYSACILIVVKKGKQTKPDATPLSAPSSNFSRHGMRNLHGNFSKHTAAGHRFTLNLTPTHSKADKRTEAKASGKWFFCINKKSQCMVSFVRTATQTNLPTRSLLVPTTVVIMPTFRLGVRRCEEQQVLSKQK